MEVFDLRIGADGDLEFNLGDIALAESTLQHQTDLLIAVPGDFRQYPLIGCGIRLALLDNATPDELSLAIQREMERDGMEVEALTITRDGNLNLKAFYVEA